VHRRQVNKSRGAIGAANSPLRRKRGENGVLTCNHKEEFAIMELERTAIHEAGHAVVAYALGYTSNEVVLTHDEVADTGYYGYVTSPHPRYGYAHNSLRDLQTTLRDASIANCAGLAAEHVFFHVPLATDDEGAQRDFRSIIALELQGLKIRRKRGGYIGDEITWRYIERCLHKAKSLVNRHRDAIQHLAHALVEKKKLSGAEVDQLLKDRVPL